MSGYHDGYSLRCLTRASRSVIMGRERDEHGRFIEQVTLMDALAVFETVAGPVVTSSDVASMTGRSGDSARRKLDTLHEQGRPGR